MREGEKGTEHSYPSLTTAILIWGTGLTPRIAAIDQGEKRCGSAINPAVGENRDLLMNMTRSGARSIF